ncbi:MAG: DUF4177 domain-containing protein [Marinisporobacter sp.]|jgi:hypothetical protein|nr:DUF4177 domain-containing protein [Marinisporobacter sp.]
MKQYEYKVIKLKQLATFSPEKYRKNLEEQLNEYGKDGWEMCSHKDYLIFLKRELLK